MSVLLQGKAAPSTIRNWWRGRYRIPQWAVDIIRRELAIKLQALQAAADGLVAAPDPTEQKKPRG